MSDNQPGDPDTQTTAKRSGTRQVTKVVRGQRSSDGAGVRLSRVIGGRALPDLDPFLLFDEFRSDEASDYIGGFPDHPHRGFETVTYMLAGRMRHGDNKGNTGLLVPGSVQWMTAGRGIVHSEMPEQENGLMWGFQLWVNLPAKDKMTAPRYQDIPPSEIPEVDAGNGIRVRVIAGRFGNVSGPVNAVATDPLYLDVALPAGISLEVPLPEDDNAFAYVFEGAAKVGGEQVARGELAVLGNGEQVELAAGPEGARLVVIAGRPLNEPVAKYGPFVMNTADEIRQAVYDYQSGRF
jgi:quercetin 2,3-dioxygenase